MDEFESIRTFMRVAERGNFSAVAREAGIGQPAVSKQIAALEARLGAQLIRRTSGSLGLTDAGQDFYEAAVRIMDDLDDARTRVGKGQVAPSGLIRVTAEPVLGRRYIVPRLSAFFELYPDISVELRSSERPVNLIEQGLDLAIHTGELDDSSLRIRRIAETPVVVVASAAYVAEFGAPSSPAELEQHRCIVFAPFGSASPWRFRGDRGLVHIQPKGAFRADDAELIRAAVLAGLGFAFAPGWLFASDLAQGSVKAVLKDFVSPPLAISAVHPAGRRLPMRMRLFIDFLARIFEEDPHLRALSAS